MLEQNLSTTKDYYNPPQLLVTRNQLKRSEKCIGPSCLSISGFFLECSCQIKPHNYRVIWEKKIIVLINFKPKNCNLYFVEKNCKWIKHTATRNRFWIVSSNFISRFRDYILLEIFFLNALNKLDLKSD